MGKHTDKLNVTASELDVFFAYNEALSDIDYGLDRETGEYTVPMIEWDGPYGKHWQRFGCEEDRSNKLDQYDRKVAAWVVGYRNRRK